VREIKDDLIVRVRVNGGHGPADDLEVSLSLGNRGQTIRRAEAFDTMWCLRVRIVFVHAEHDGEIFVLGRCRNDDLLHAATQMFLRFVGVGKAAGGLEDDLRANGIPGQSGGSFSLNTLMTLPSIEMLSGPAVILWGRLQGLSRT